MRIVKLDEASMKNILADMLKRDPNNYDAYTETVQEIVDKVKMCIRDRTLREEELKELERKINEKDRTHILDGVSAVLFDLDGTLVDSMWMWEAIDIEYLDVYKRQDQEIPEDHQPAGNHFK